MFRILSIEDDENAQHSIGRALFQNGYEVHYAWNGQEGWEKVLTVDPDLVLLGLRLPVFNGLGILERVRAHKSVRDIPVIIVTSDGDDDGMVRETLNELGVERLLRKPLDFAELLRGVKSVLAAHPRVPARAAPPRARVLRKFAVAADPVLLTVWVEDKPVATLHAKEFAVLRILLESPGPVRRGALMQGLGYRAAQDAALTQAVHRLRWALGDAHRIRVRTTQEGYELVG